MFSVFKQSNKVRSKSIIKTFLLMIAMGLVLFTININSVMQLSTLGNESLWQTIRAHDDFNSGALQNYDDNFFQKRYNFTGDRNAIMLDRLELFVRMTGSKRKLYDYVLVKSMWYFWPGKTSMTVVLDAESPVDQHVGGTLPLRYPFPKVLYASDVNSKIYHGLGHERMQRDFFYMEKYVEKEYVGIVDTDTLFVTHVTPELLFDNGKPIVMAVYGNALNDWWYKASLTTMKFFKEREVMQCMSYFPVIVKVQHIVELRLYLEELHRKPFDKLFQKFNTPDTPMCQFSLLCQYIWKFHRDQYSFHFEMIRNPEFGQSPGRMPMDYYDKNVTPQQRHPKPRTSIHYRYVRNWTDERTYRDLLKSAICYSGGFDICPEKCQHLNKSALHTDLFTFEFHDWTWDNRCLDAQRAHYDVVRQRQNFDTFKIIQVGCKEVDNLQFVAE